MVKLDRAAHAATGYITYSIHRHMLPSQNTQPVLSSFDNLYDITKSKLARKQTVATNIHYDSENNIEQVWKNK